DSQELVEQIETSSENNISKETKVTELTQVLTDKEGKLK
ncbi:uncharacterized protein LOC131067056, partial [Cryptomeria japonica]